MPTESEIKKYRAGFIKILQSFGFDVKLFEGSRYIKHKGENNESV